MRSKSGTDLSLVSINEMIEEVESRCISFISAYTLRDPQDREIIYQRFRKGQWDNACKLSNILNNSVLNDWSGELRTLQRIAEEEEDD